MDLGIEGRIAPRSRPDRPGSGSALLPHSRARAAPSPSAAGAPTGCVTPWPDSAATRSASRRTSAIPRRPRRFVAAEAAEGLGGPLDIVVANAGGPPHGSASAADLDGYGPPSS